MGRRTGKAGRASEFTPEIGAVICARIKTGESVCSIARDPQMPAESTIYKWLADFDTFSEDYARAKLVGLEKMADDLLAIADDGSNDYTVDDEGEQQVNYDHIQRSKLRVDTRKWILSKLLPKKYGDRQHVEHTGKLSLEQIVAGSIEPVAKEGDES